MVSLVFFLDLLHLLMNIDYFLVLVRLAAHFVVFLINFD